MKQRTQAISHSSNSGFTLVELLVVIPIIGLLASLMLPALAKAKSKSHRINCLSNIKQLNICWASYTQDHNGMLPESYFAYSLGSVNTNAWVRGTVDDNPAFGQVEPGKLDSTNVACLKLGSLWLYNTSAGVYRCPSDKSMTAGVPRVRSYSINSWMGGVALPGEDNYRVFHRETDVISPAPSQAVVVFRNQQTRKKRGSRANTCVAW